MTIRKSQLVAAIIIVVAALLILWDMFGPRLRVGLFDWDRAQRTTIQLLRTEKMLFLVTHRVATLVMVESREHSLLFGDREGFLIGEVRMLYGVNLEELKDDSVRREGERLVVTVPEPRPLSFEVDMESLRFFSKRSGTMVLADWVAGRDLREELQKEFKGTAMKYLHDKGLLPGRNEIVGRLNGLAGLFSSKIGVAVEFK